MTATFPSSLCQNVLKWSNTVSVLKYFCSSRQQFLASLCPLHADTQTTWVSLLETVQAFSQTTCAEETKDFRSSLSQVLTALMFIQHFFLDSGVPQGSIPGPGRNLSRGRYRWWWVARQQGTWANQAAARTGHVSSPRGCSSSSSGQPSRCSTDTSASFPQCTSHGCRTRGIWRGGAS